MKDFAPPPPATLHPTVSPCSEIGSFIDRALMTTEAQTFLAELPYKSKIDPTCAIGRRNQLLS